MYTFSCTHFLVVLFPPNETLLTELPGRCGCFVFLVINVTPPLSPSAGTTPTACSNQYLNSGYLSISAYLVVDETGILDKN